MQPESGAARFRVAIVVAVVIVFVVGGLAVLGSAMVDAANWPATSAEAAVGLQSGTPRDVEQVAWKLANHPALIDDAVSMQMLYIIVGGRSDIDQTTTWMLAHLVESYPERVVDGLAMLAVGGKLEQWFAVGSQPGWLAEVIVRVVRAQHPASVGPTAPIGSTPMVSFESGAGLTDELKVRVLQEVLPAFGLQYAPGRP